MTAAALDARVMRAISRNPGIRCDEIAAKLQVKTLVVRRSLSRLKYHNRVRGEGNTRATSYYKS